MGEIHPAISEIYVPQSLDPICGQFENFFAHRQADTGQMAKWPWQCTTTGLDNCTKFWTEKIRRTVTEIWVPQVWQLPAWQPARTVKTIPLQPSGLRGTNPLNFPWIFSKFIFLLNYMEISRFMKDFCLAWNFVPCTLCLICCTTDLTGLELSFYMTFK